MRNENKTNEKALGVLNKIMSVTIAHSTHTTAVSPSIRVKFISVKANIQYKPRTSKLLFTVRMPCQLLLVKKNMFLIRRMPSFNATLF